MSVRRPLLQSVRRRVFYSTAAAAEPVLKIQQIPAPGSGHVRVLLLNRPQARNALSRQLLDSLAQQIRAIAAEAGCGPTRALVLGTNVDAAFCAGADLKERARMSKQETDDFLAQLRGTFRELAALPVPTIAAVSATALGGGLELALCTHLRVFGSSTIVGLPETRLAIIPGAGGTYRLPRVVGPSRARDMILTGRRVSGAEAYFMGLCDRLVEVLPDEQDEPQQQQQQPPTGSASAREKVLRESIRLALDISEGGPVAIRQALQAVDRFEMGEQAENEAYAGVLDTEDRYEALRAFAEKRRPVYKGR